jgi:septal ring factor EnvC (AmiA/AmiB activator)
MHDRIVALEKGQEDLRLGIAIVRDQANELSMKLVALNTRFDRLEAQVRDTNRKLIDLREEMQQRFRIVTERLSALEQRLAA